MKFLAMMLLAASCGASTTNAAMDPAPAVVPSVVGQGLSVAVDAMKQAGFDSVKSSDVSGRGRIVVARRDWQVCAQQPGPGAAQPATPIALSVVKVGESCPVAEAQVKPGTMPDLKGKSIRVARQSLPPRTSIKITDASGQNRITLRDTNWQVCTQSPADGDSLTGQPVTLDVTKYGESCP